MLGRTNTGGGGAALNFKVVRYDPGAELPASAAENAIAVFTNVDITGWYFSATQPENMKQGELWFKTVLSSNVAFNALKKNSIVVSPSSAKQHIDGALVDVTAKTYRDNKWVDWCFYYFLAGEGFAEGYTGFTSMGANSTDDLLVVYIFLQNNIRIGESDSIETIDVTNFSKLTIHISGIFIGGNNDNNNVKSYIELRKNGTGVSTVQVCDTNVKDQFAVTDKTVEFDLSNITGGITIRVYSQSTSTSYHSGTSTEIDEIRFE